jgi:hypothetical protein
VKGVGAIVGSELVSLAAVEGVETAVGETIGDTTNGLAEEGSVVGFVLLSCVEALDDVDAVDGEGLDDGAEGQEGESVVWHDGGIGLQKEGTEDF